MKFIKFCLSVATAVLPLAAMAGELQTKNNQAVLFAAPLPSDPSHQNILYCLQDKCERIGSEAGYTNKEFEWMQDRCDGLSSAWKNYALQIIFTGVGGVISAWWPAQIAGAFAGGYVADFATPDESPDVYEISATYLNSLDSSTARFEIPFEKMVKIQKGVRSCVEMYEVYKKSAPVFKRQMDRGFWVPFG